MPRGERDSGPDLVGIYLNEIGQHPLLTHAEVVELAQVKDAGLVIETRLNAERKEQKVRVEPTPEEAELIARGTEAANNIWKSNLRLVVSIAKRYPSDSPSQFLEYIQEGNKGLRHAIRKFDWTRGFTMSTYATYWIKQYIGRRGTTPPVYMGVNDYAEMLTALRQVGSADELEPEMLHRYNAAHPQSIDKVSPRTGLSPADRLPDQFSSTPEEVAVGNVMHELVRNALDRLDEQSREAVIFRFAFDEPHSDTRSYRQVAERMGVSLHTATKLVKTALESLEHFAELHPEDLASV